jgi:hypothetical protein
MLDLQGVLLHMLVQVAPYVSQLRRYIKKRKAQAKKKKGKASDAEGPTSAADTQSPAEVAIPHAISNARIQVTNSLLPSHH